MVRAHGDEYRRAHTPSAEQEAVLRNIAQCRTAALGGHVDECDSCDHQRISYNSCRDRHCPKCLNLKRAEWLTQRLSRLLPVGYFHVVFTIPDELNPLALRNKKVVFDILFATAAQTLQEIAADPKHLGGQLGFTAVLHTWGQNLLFHPHVHSVVTGGGLSPDGSRWIAGRERFLLPVKVLGRLFRGKFLHALDQAWKQKKLSFGGSTASLADSQNWRNLKDGLYKKAWVVYAKPPFGGPEHVFRYLGRYTHRVAISNHRIVDITNDKVTFTIKDYTDGNTRKLLTLDGAEFLRRFLLHVLPPGFVRIRHYGLCAGRNVNTKLETARRLLQPDRPTEARPTHDAPAETSESPWWERFREATGIDVMACPECGTGRMMRVRPVSPALADRRVSLEGIDSS